MGKTTGFKEYDRELEGYKPVDERVTHYKEFTIPLEKKAIEEQGSRCMDCGIPFCHSACPLGNLIPDFNDMVHHGEWEKALHILHSTNNFPEFTGRLCPAPCEQACVLGIIKPPISIENLEKNIVEIGFKNGWINPAKPLISTGKSVAIIGSGPSGLAAAQQLNRAGHKVTVFERDDKVGGLLRYGIPNFKLEKEVIDRRVAILEAEGIVFKTATEVGKNYALKKLDAFDAILLCGGATKTRSLPIKGIEIPGVEQAMPFLKQQNKRNAGILFDASDILATDKNVIVIGGGDTGSDCIGTSNRQGAKNVTNFEIMPKPPGDRAETTPWPFWPLQLKTSTSHEEGCDRNWLISTKSFNADVQGKLESLTTINVAWKFKKGGRPQLVEIEGTEKTWPCELVLLALGFTGPEATLAEKFGIETGPRSNYKARNYQTNKAHIFVAGDMRRGQSLIVWAISEGREAARSIDTYLMGSSSLPTKGEGDLPAM
ncbi:MAG: glutamate synthase subunit beta [Flavobacteriaceae bacterium]|nr:glutamate synthase subunit beta [Flavobacteriaceae bacterium]